MVKPPLRTKSIGFKVSEEEYAQLETAAQADGRTLGEWCREVILRGGSASDAERHDPALAEIIGVRLLLVNVLGPLAAGAYSGCIILAAILATKRRGATRSPSTMSQFLAPEITQVLPRAIPSRPTRATFSAVSAERKTRSGCSATV